MEIRAFIIPYDSARLAYHWREAERCSKSENFWRRHFESSGHVCAAIDLSFIEIVRYPLQGALFFVRNCFNETGERAWKDLGADIYAVVQLSFLIPFQIYMLMVGLFFPQRAYKTIDPYPVNSSHTRIGGQEGEIENLISEENDLLKMLEAAEERAARYLKELEERTYECEALNLCVEGEKEERSRNLQQEKQKIQELQCEHDRNLNELNTLKETLRNRSPRSHSRTFPFTPLRSQTQNSLPPTGLRYQVPVGLMTPFLSSASVSVVLPRPEPISEEAIPDLSPIFLKVGEQLSKSPSIPSETIIENCLSEIAQSPQNKYAIAWCDTTLAHSATSKIPSVGQPSGTLSRALGQAVNQREIRRKLAGYPSLTPTEQKDAADELLEALKLSVSKRRPAIAGQQGGNGDGDSDWDD